jgi:hypothetical protein
LAAGRHGHPIPAFEVRRWKNVNPTLWIALQSARGFRPSGLEIAEETGSQHEKGGNDRERLVQFIEHH